MAEELEWISGREPNDSDGVGLLNQPALRGILVLLITGWRESDTGDVTFWVTTALLGAEAGRLLLRAPG